MDRIYANSEEKFVKTTILYISEDEVNSDQSGSIITAYAYEDPECTRKVDSATLEDLFFKGVVFHTPTRKKDEPGYEMGYVTPAVGIPMNGGGFRFFAILLSDMNLGYTVEVIGGDIPLE